MTNKKKGLGVPRPKAPGRSTAAAGYAEPSRPPSRKRLRPIKRGSIVRMCALSGFNYHWIGMYARVLKCQVSQHTNSKLSVDFEPIGWSIPSGNYKGWDRAWFDLALPPLRDRPAKGIAAKNPQRVSARIRSGKPGASSSKHSPKPSKKK